MVCALSQQNLDGFLNGLMYVAQAGLDCVAEDARSS